MIYSILLCSNLSWGFFGLDATVAETMKKVEGAAAASIMIDNVRNTSTGKIDIGELERLAIQHSEEIAKYRGKSITAAREKERVRNLDRNNTKASEATKALNKTVALYSSLCALSPESCQTAAQEVGNRKQEETKLEVTRLKNEIQKKNLEDKIRNLKEMNSRKSTLDAIEKTPTKLFNFLRDKE